jgi:hypothetical protein
MSRRLTASANLATAGVGAVVAIGIGFFVAGPSLASERSYPVDCWPDRMVDWLPVAANPLSLFGAAFVPGIVLGPPGNSAPQEGSLSVATLGFGGSVILAFDDIVIEDRPGPDFIVFENAFFRLPLPTTATDDFRVFVEPALVEVSADGLEWHSFPYDTAALAQASAVPDVDRQVFLQLVGLAGITPTLTGNWTLPNDPALFDPQGIGGISGAGGDAFDLADVGLGEARFVRITDLNSRNGFAGSGEGFDLDALVVVHGRPLPTVATDLDGDGLSDLAEQRLYGSNPDLIDSDADGIDDGREVAGCRDPSSSSTDPWRHHEPRLWVESIGPCHDLRWTFLGTGVTYEVLRGSLGELSESVIEVDLGLVACLDSGVTAPRFSCDAELLAPGEGRFFLVRAESEIGFGRSSRLNDRRAVVVCP